METVTKTNELFSKAEKRRFDKYHTALQDLHGALKYTTHLSSFRWEKKHKLTSGAFSVLVSLGYVDRDGRRGAVRWNAEEPTKTMARAWMNKTLKLHTDAIKKSREKNKGVVSFQKPDSRKVSKPKKQSKKLLVGYRVYLFGLKIATINPFIFNEKAR